MTDWSSFIKNVPVVGWIALFFILGIVLFALYEIYLIMKSKNIRLKDIEIMEKTQEVQKEAYRTEGKNVLDNQCSNAHHILEKVWIKIFEISKTKFSLKSKTELDLMEDIAHLIESELNFEVKNDLTRNHIIEKNDLELTKYSDAKARGYHSAVIAMLYKYNYQLPDYELPKIMENFSIDEFKKIFDEIYFNARKIAGGKEDKDE